MSAFEQRVEVPPDRTYQYLLVAAEPYETCAFKLQAREVDKSPGKFWTHYDPDTKEFFLQLFFKTEREERCKFFPFFFTFCYWIFANFGWWLIAFLILQMLVCLDWHLLDLGGRNMPFTYLMLVLRKLPSARGYENRDSVVFFIF